jgi:predicted transcriptional regulator
MISPAQCRAARAWLKMDQSLVAKLARCDRDTIRRFEGEHHQLKHSTIARIKSVFEAKGVSFTFGRDDEALGIEQIRS